jgi:hypothetical protein
VNHLFISCPFAKLVWRVVHATFDITPPTNITNLFGNWLNGIDKKTRAKIRIGVLALVWSIWNCRNNIVFNRKDSTIFFACYSYGYTLDSAMAFPIPGGSAGMYGFWMQPAAWLRRISSTRLPGGLLVDYTMLSITKSCVLFRWSIFVSTVSNP